MKITKLTMSAFMTYQKKTTVHFEDFIDHGLYLISGPTGSGKTTLFDAITFALYGVASGSHRNQSNYFRSDYALAQDETYVELEFELHQKHYIVRRMPTYNREGYKTAKMATASLKYDGKEIEGIKEVNAKINEILGVDVHQFKQIVMIAQGEFTKLIYASSEEREKVLRHIFHSYSLVRFEERLKEEVRVKKDNYFKSSQILLSLIQLLSFVDEISVSDQFHPSIIDKAVLKNEELKQQTYLVLKDYEKKKEKYDQHAHQLAEKDNLNLLAKNYEKTKVNYQELIKKETLMNQYQKDIEKMQIIKDNQSLLDQNKSLTNELYTIHQRYEEVKLKQTTLLSSFQSIEKEYQQVPSLKQQQEQLQKEQEQLKQKKEQQLQYLEYQSKEKQAQKNYICLQEELKQKTDEYNHFVNRIERDEETVSQLPSLQADLQKHEQYVKETNQRRITIHELSENYDQYNLLQDQYYELSQTYKEKVQNYQSLNVQYMKEDEKFKQQQAGILALSLKDNTPCPVCGSLHHPHLAQLSSSVLSQSELEHLYQKVELSAKEKETAYQDVLSSKEKMQAVQIQIQILKEQLEIKEELSKEVFMQLLALMSREIQEKEKIYTKLSNEVNYVKKLKKSLQQDLIKQQQRLKQLENLKEKVSTADKQLAIYQSQVQQLLEQIDVSLHYDSLYQEKERQSQQLKNTIQQKENTYHTTIENLSIYKTQVTSYQNQIKEKEALFLSNKNQINKIIESSFNSLNQFQDYLALMPKLLHYQEEYQDYVMKKTQYLSQLKTLKENLQDYFYQDLTNEKQILLQEEKEKEESFKEYNALLHLYQTNEDIIKKIKKEYETNQSLFDDYTLYLDLYDQASGKNIKKMSFERYVLSSYFEQILEYANIELKKMSQGRFALYRKKETKGVKQQGLDLSVLDYETGMIRDIQSLSGGESFKAALSLALGLSSMIQSYAGGIELNTLFIDEGFGTLDHESIDQALSVLMELHQDHKVIGIISHVDELKERIPTQIVVTKADKGSCLHVEL